MPKLRPVRERNRLSGCFSVSLKPSPPWEAQKTNLPPRRVPSRLAKTRFREAPAFGPAAGFPGLHAETWAPCSAIVQVQVGEGGRRRAHPCELGGGLPEDKPRAEPAALPPGSSAQVTPDRAPSLTSLTPSHFHPQTCPRGARPAGPTQPQAACSLAARGLPCLLKYLASGKGPEEAPAASRLASSTPSPRSSIPGSQPGRSTGRPRTHLSSSKNPPKPGIAAPAPAVRARLAPRSEAAAPRRGEHPRRGPPGALAPFHPLQHTHWPS